MKTGIELIAEERQRQIAEEGWTPEHDDLHFGGELADAAACYAALAAIESRGPITQLHVEHLTLGFSDSLTWPFDEEWLKADGGRIRNLQKAGALIAAEIDRLQRATKP